MDVVNNGSTEPLKVVGRDQAFGQLVAESVDINVCSVFPDEAS